MKNIPYVMIRILRGAIAMSFLAAVSCTAYRPIRTGEASPGYDVRVDLTDRGAVNLAPRIGPRARQLDGTLRQVTDSSLVVSVRRVVREAGGEDTYGGEEIPLKSEDFESVEASRTSVPRSILAAAAVLASVFLAAKGAGNASGGQTGGPPPPGK
jgi:hypothetical protein